MQHHRCLDRAQVRLQQDHKASRVWVAEDRLWHVVDQTVLVLWRVAQRVDQVGVEAELRAESPAEARVIRGQDVAGGAEHRRERDQSLHRKAALVAMRVHAPIYTRIYELVH